MSRIGKQPVIIPGGVTAKIEGGRLTVNGPKGQLSFKPQPVIKLVIENNKITVSRTRGDKFGRAMHGLTRSLIANMVEGVTSGFSKSLKIVGTGYRARLEGGDLILSLGFSHPVVFKQPVGITLSIEDKDTIKVSGIDKELVGQVAAKIRASRPPEPYKGKGIRYADEVVRKKAGKAGKVGVTGAPAGG